MWSAQSVNIYITLINTQALDRALHVCGYTQQAVKWRWRSTLCAASRVILPRTAAIAQ
jgi:hypothetical protein